MAALDIARCAADLLKPGGYLLLADMMRADAEYNQGIFSNCHVVEELHAALVQSGFTLVKAEDISAQVAPTLDLYVESVRIWGLSTIRYIADVVAIAVPPLYLLLQWMFKGLVKKIVLEMLESQQIFADHLCYQIQLWQVTKTDR
jgi:MPBQ/MSBQ methyltransferase